MLNVPKWKITIALVVCIYSIITLAPNFSKTSEEAQKINLGLDLQGGAYLLLEIDQKAYFEEKIERTETKPGRRYIYIEPSLRNLVYDDSISSDQASNQAPSSNILGPAGDADCWDKTLKIRVTSKKTGKKVDLNVTFKNTGVVTP